MQGIKKAYVILGLRRCSLFQNRTGHSNFNFLVKDHSTIDILNCRYCTAVLNASTSGDNRFQNPKIASLLEVTVKEGIKPDDLLSAIETSPELMTKSPLQWENCFKELKYHGFTTKDSLQMLIHYPQLLNIVEKGELNSSMEVWLNCQLGFENVLNLLVECPHFLSVRGRELSRRIPLLQSLAKSRGKNVTKLLQNCPSLLFQNWKDVEAKLAYVEDVMKIDTKKENITKCYMFNRSLDEIKTRHVFLQRAGIYITPGRIKKTRKEQAQQPWSNNPRLSQITDTSDVKFISEVANSLTVEELEVFREMYSEQLDEENVSGSDDDSSDDE
ncbi:hypothetical protein ANN_12783 [Periplaneta americana]|uniref:Transcription termination factor 4, mitochondrial n=1 Tax=Periplaneta americana TaxID=6978 RepID=A0ABQ8TIX8_PERAM|nr:hypothetical protein ANN_12783 [Periplaneta americana]